MKQSSLFIFSALVAYGLCSSTCRTLYASTSPSSTSRIPTKTTTVVDTHYVTKTSTKTPVFVPTVTVTTTKYSGQKTATVSSNKTPSTTVTSTTHQLETVTTVKTRVVVTTALGTPKQITKTVATPSGFVPIRVDQPDQHYKRAPYHDPAVAKRAIYLTAVDCTVQIETTKTVTLTSTGSVTRTATGSERATKTLTITVAKTVTTTKTSLLSSTKTFIVVTTITTTRLITSTRTSRSTTTSTDPGLAPPAKTSFAVCAIENFSSHYDGDDTPITDFSLNTGGLTLTVDGLTLQECCEVCARQSSTCQGATYKVSNGTCFIIQESPVNGFQFDCDPTFYAFNGYVYEDAKDEDRYFLMNG